MAITDQDVSRLRRMIAEPTAETYTDPDIRSYIERHPTRDVNGRQQYKDGWVDGYLGRVLDSLWVPTYSLEAAAADIWEEKAAALADKFSYSADGGNYNPGQAHEQAKRMAAFYRGKAPAKVAVLRVHPDPRDRTFEPWDSDISN